MEVVWFCSKANLAKLAATDSSETIQSFPVIMGVLLDAHLSMKQHINKVAMATTCYYQLSSWTRKLDSAGTETLHVSARLLQFISSSSSTVCS